MHCVCARLKGVFWAPFHEMGFILHLQQLPKPTYVVVMRCLAQTRMCVKICKELGHQYLALTKEKSMPETAHLQDAKNMD